MEPYDLFWGETHDNTYQFSEMPFPLEASVRRARAHLDFYAAAYYTASAEAFRPGGHLSEQAEVTQIPLEGWKPSAQLQREWAEVNDVTRSCNAPGEFVTFPGYEWQGNGSSGDHNVIARQEGLPLFEVDTLAELYDRLRDHTALAIPHHVGYRAGVRGRDWSVMDETLSPFCEIFSVHGCSETDEEWIGLRNNPHMGPGTGGSTWEDALQRGWHLGAICSTDNWGAMPGHFGRGRMACLAEELTRESLWEAFCARRVYGVTGDRIELDFTLDGQPMGSILQGSDIRKIRVNVRGSDAIDRIELLRNGRVIATHCHQGTWSIPPSGRRHRFKLRIEAGWGPRRGELPARSHSWEGKLHIKDGRIQGTEPCWVSPGQGTPRVDGDTATFTFLTPVDLPEYWHNADVFEFDADPGSPVRIQMNERQAEATAAELAQGSRELWYKDECVSLLERHAGIEPYSPERMDVYHHLAYKVKIHRAIPEAGYTASLDVDDDEPLCGETHYRVRVEQRNGQRAWSSPIWVQPSARS